jgi:cytochrome b
MIKVWDGFTRIFHWLLVALVGFAWYTAEEGQMERHMWTGLAIFVLVATRIIWGFVGSTTSRFSHFLKGPKAVIAYLKGLRPGAAPAVFGHTPTGGWAILALLLVLLAMPSLGVFANDDILFRGPLAHMVDKDVSDSLTELHEVLFNLLLVLVIAHVAAIVIYRVVFKENLIHPMITGKRHWSGPAAEATFRSPLLALSIAAVVALAVYFLVLK